jgi:hypothetical protein
MAEERVQRRLSAMNGSYIARIVRVTKRPINGKDSYCVLIDQPPTPHTKRTSAVNLLDYCAGSASRSYRSAARSSAALA